MAILNLPKDERKRIAQRLCSEIRESERAKGSLPARWKRLEAIYRVLPETSALQLADGMQAYALPLWRQKADRIIGSTYSGITSLYPYVQVIEEGGDGQNDEDVERALMHLALSSGIDLALKNAIRVSLNCGIGVIRVRLVERDGTIRVESGNVHPHHLTVGPTYTQDPAVIQTIGHRFYLPQYRVTERQDGEDYYKDVDVPGGDDPTLYEDRSAAMSRDQWTQPSEVDERPVELAELETYVKVKGERIRCRVVVAVTAEETLRIEPVEQDTWTYVVFRMLTEDGGFWPNDSVAQPTQGLNLILNDAFTACMQGSLLASAPVIAVIGGQLSGGAKRYGMGEVWEFPEGVQVEVLKTGFDPGFLPALIEKTEQMADAVTGIGQTGTSQNLQSGTTATEANAIVAAQQEAKDQFIDAISPSVKEVFEVLLGFLRLHYPELRESYGPAVEVPEGALDKTYRLEVTGKSGASNPASLIQKLQMVGQMAAAPNSMNDPAKVEEKIVQMLDFPFSADSLKKDDLSEAMQALMQLKDMAGVDPRLVVQLGAQPIIERINAQRQMQAMAEEGANGPDSRSGVPSQVAQEPGMAMGESPMAGLAGA